ncbi:MAG: hypothetical protein ACYDCQ_03590 [Dehalococcoidia bacterium]
MPDDTPARPGRRFTIVPGNLLDVLQPEAEDADESLEPDDPQHAIGRTVARVDVEPGFATLYLTFDDGSYLTFAARVDEEGVILLDRFCEPAASYDEYFVFEELDGESGPPPDRAAPEPGSAFDPTTWVGAAGRRIDELGWYEEGMQSFIHFDDGAYLTAAARAAAGSAYLVGYFSPDAPAAADYFHFPLPDENE